MNSRRGHVRRLANRIPMMRLTILWSMPALCLLALVPAASAHSISLVEAEALVHRDNIELKIEVRAEDILLSAGMSIIFTDRIDKAVFVKGAEAHKKFLSDGLIVRDADGHRLTGKITRVELPPIQDDGISLDDVRIKTAIYHFEYPLEKPPTSLSFLQHFDTGAVALPVVMEIRVVREGQSTGTTICVPGGEDAERVTFDWATATTTVAERATTRPSAPDAAEAFVYIQDDQVRIEILMPLTALETWQPIPRSNPDFLEVDEQASAHAALEALFVSHNELKIDGVMVRPTLDRLDFYRIDSKDFAMLPKPQRLNAASARIGAILTYSTKGAPATSS